MGNDSGVGGARGQTWPTGKSALLCLLIKPGGRVLHLWGAEAGRQPPPPPPLLDKASGQGGEAGRKQHLMGSGAWGVGAVLLRPSLCL